MANLSVNLLSANPPEELKVAYDDAIKSREDEQRKINEAEAYRNEIIERAAGDADRVRLEAQAYKEQVVARAEAAWRFDHVPLAAAEGFIRQILGWREYVRGVYWAHMPGYAAHNVFGHKRPIPPWFWNGETKMRCLANAIGHSLKYAHAHHIQRLMVIGNFALLAGIDPEAVHRWYLGVYIDAFEWVELPNTLGMSQFADGGLMATKPYVSSAAYINRMSDYCKGCHYDKKLREGEKACPFNALYWDFFARNTDKLSANPRLGMVYRQLQKMGGGAVQLLQGQARELRLRLDYL